MQLLAKHSQLYWDILKPISSFNIYSIIFKWNPQLYKLVQFPLFRILWNVFAIEFLDIQGDHPMLGIKSFKHLYLQLVKSSQILWIPIIMFFKAWLYYSVLIIYWNVLDPWILFNFELNISQFQIFLYTLEPYFILFQFQLLIYQAAIFVCFLLKAWIYFGVHDL